MQLPERISDDRLNQLVPKLIAGEITDNERLEIINGHIKLVMKLVNARRNRFLIDDMFQEAMLWATQAVRWCEPPESRLNQTEKNLTAYIAYTVKKRLKDLLEKSWLVGMKGRALRLKIQQGVDPETLPFTMKRYEVGSDYSRELIEQSMYVPVSKPELSIEFKEAMKRSTPLPLHQAILNMKAESYTLEEIANKVGFHRSRIHQIMAEIEKSFDYYWE